MYPCIGQSIESKALNCLTNDGGGHKDMNKEKVNLCGGGNSRGGCRGRNR